MIEIAKPEITAMAVPTKNNQRPLQSKATIAATEELKPVWARLAGMTILLQLL